MRILVTGANGQLGHDVVKEALKRGFEVVGTGSRDKENRPIDSNYIQLDIKDRDAVFSVIEKVRPDIVIHCAAWTNVDMAEKKENRDKVYAVNHLGTKHIAEACRKIDAKILYISTDYVFSGHGDKPYPSDCDVFLPLNVYGDSKLQGENEIREMLKKYFIIRTSWVYGINGNNFIKTMLNLSKNHNEIQVVNDQIGRPTYTKDLAELIVEMINTDKYGTYNATNEGDYISWYDFAVEIFKTADIEIKVNPVSTEKYGSSTARRPLNSRLDTSKLKDNGFTPLPDWKDGLKRYMEELKKDNYLS